MSSLRKLTGFLRPYWKIAILGPIFMFIEVVMDLAHPRLVQRIIDEGVARLDMSIVTNTGLLMLCVALLGVSCGIGGALFAVRASQYFGADLRSTLFRKVQSLSFGNLDNLETGHLVTRLTNDVTQVQEAVFLGLHILVRMPMTLVGSLVMAVIISPRLALMFVLLVPIVTIVLSVVIMKAHNLFAGVQRRLDILNTVMLENLAGVRVVKAFVRAAYEKKRFGEANNNMMDQTTRALQLVAISMPFMMLALNMGIVSVIWFGGLQVTHGTMKVGQIIAFVNYLIQSLFSIMMVSMLLMRISRASASANRIQEILEDRPMIRNRPDALQTFSSKGRVAFDNVTFSYNNNAGDAVLRDVSFVAEPGQTIAILGSTGSGKSSLVHLIPRFYDVTGGRVCIDGVDVRDMTKESLRSNIGISMQDVILFSGSIIDNIRYGRPDATDGDVIDAAMAAQAHEFITEFPDSYDTQLGQRGVNLSGGQKQRLSIARALITRPSILILDDSTSAVDVETETRIQNAMASIMEGCTSFVIAQRISTVLNAEKILVLDNGSIAAQGTHSELFKSSPIYKEIYESQLGNGVGANG